MSGVNMGSDGVNPLHFQLLTEFLTAETGSADVCQNPCLHLINSRNINFKKILQTLLLLETPCSGKMKAIYKITASYVL